MRKFKVYNFCIVQTLLIGSIQAQWQKARFFCVFDHTISPLRKKLVTIIQHAVF